MQHLTELNACINQWSDALRRYHYKQLIAQPAPGSWSMGQLYQHLVNDGEFYLQQMTACNANENCDAITNPVAQEIFEQKKLPAERIEGDPSNAMIPQPGSIEQLETGLRKLQQQVNEAWPTCAGSQGKTAHPGLGYFTAAEWLQFSVIHFCHHLRQQKTIEEFLFNSSAQLT